MDKVPGKKITVTKDGPYKVEGGVEINIATLGCDANGDAVSWIKGKSYSEGDAPKEQVFLCRCGHSQNAPFCDGSHRKVGFHGTEQPDKGTYAERAEAQESDCDDVTLLDDFSLCVGARFCDPGETVWNYAERASDPKACEMMVQEACKCPSGRLTVIDKGGKAVEPELAPAVSLIQDPINDCRGPLWVQGGIAIKNADGDKYEVRNRVTLCRCGESHNQPYCDSSHYDCPHMKGADS
jgi:CDGSH-type Zn-finger protein